MATISSYTLPQMTDLVQRTFTERPALMEQAMRTSGFVVESQKPMHTWEFSRYAQRVHRNQYASRRDEWDVSTQARFQYGYEKDLQIHTVSLEISITKRMRVAGKDQQILQEIEDLSEVCPATMDLDLAHRLTFAWATTYTDRDGNSIDVSVGDSLALISASHTLTGSATTYSNQITGNPQFSKGSLETAEKSFVEEAYNNLGERIALKWPFTIVTTADPNTVNQVRELMNATADVNTSNSGTFNVYNQKYRHVIVPRINTTASGAIDTTKNKYWFLVADQHSDFYIEILEQPYLKSPMDGNNGEEFSSENWNYLAAATYGITVVSGFWIRGSKGDWS